MPHALNLPVGRWMLVLPWMLAAVSAPAAMPSAPGAPASMTAPGQALDDPMLAQVRQKILQQGVPQAQRAIAQIARNYALAQQNAAVNTVLLGLDASFNPSTGAGPMAQVINPKDSAQAQIDTLWLASKVYSNQADGRYSYLYASLLSRTRFGKVLDTRGAAVQFFRANLALTIDGARCSDPSGVTTVVHGYEDSPMGAALKAQVNTLDPSTLIDARFDAISLETALGPRAPVGWLCLQSQSAMNRQPVSFVTDQQWYQRRQRILDGATQATLAYALRSTPAQPLPAASTVSPSIIKGVAPAH